MNVGDKVKLKSLKEIKSMFNLFVYQENDIKNKQNEIFEIRDIDFNGNFITVDREIFKGDYGAAINRAALKKYSKRIRIPEKYFEL